jgi:uncharacterized RDD family membrane protein YckC
VSRSQARRLYHRLQRERRLKKHHLYPFWVMRLCSVGIDLGLCGTLVGFLQHWFRLTQPLVLLPIYAAYFFALELWQGRTIGKMVFGWRLCTPSGRKPIAPLLILRTFLRCAGPIGFLMMLSWQRVTLLDLVTGMRVVRIDRLDNLGNPIVRAKEPTPCALGWR